MSNRKLIARPGQLLCDHLSEAGDLCSIFGGKLGLPLTTRLLGNLHDIGKHSKQFQRYIHSIAGSIKSGEADYLDPIANKGKIDHSTAGAQWIWENAPDGKLSKAIAQILAVCIASHHGGLIDCLTPEGENFFQKRISSSEEKTHLSESLKSIPAELTALFESLYLSEKIHKELTNSIMKIAKSSKGNSTSLDFGLGMLTRICLSCLVDADHSNSAERIPEPPINWDVLCSKFEDFIKTLDQSKPINQIRSSISNQCLDSANRSMGTFQLTVPTGGGKTLASLRFALHHAKKHNLERIFYIIPYTSIIDQNAQVVRDILEEGSDTNVVLEHHSNLTQKNDTEHNRLLAENWDSPIVFTTLVQFLETLFGSGTRGVRRMHRLSNAVIIFDEPQTLPIKVIHLFNQSVNLLRQQWKSTVILCTATQPIFHQVNPAKGAMELSSDPDLIQDKNNLFEQLRRVEVTNQCNAGNWSIEEVTSLIRAKMKSHHSVLYIANTKNAARMIYEGVKNDADLVVHLSTNMCPAHRRQKFKDLNEALSSAKTQKVICVSTQLIEAGVDVSFDCVMRSLAGLDSIAQAAGRCNRHAESDEKGEVIIINPSFENLGSLEEMKVAQQCSNRFFREFEKNPDSFSNNLIGLEALQRYYEFVYFDRADKMDYPTDIGTLLSLLSSNETPKVEHKRKNGTLPQLFLNQSFKSANRAFEAIESPTESIVVPYGEKGRAIIGDLCAETWDPNEAFKLRKRAQQYSVNVFPNTLTKLRKANAIHETSPESGIYYLKEAFYTGTYGLSPEGDGSLAFLTIE